MKPVLKSAAERLQFAKAEIKRTERRIDDATERRRAILREHDANSTAAIRADDEIAALRLLRLRYIDQAELLSTVAAQENRETWPSDLPAALAAEAETGADLAYCERVPKLDRSAALDQRTDHLRQRQYALRKLIASLQPRSDLA